MDAQRFITLEDVTVRVGGVWVIKGLNWEIRRGENWVLWGANGAGKTSLARALLGEAAIVGGKLRRHYSGRGKTGDDPGRREPVALVSPDQQFDLFRSEQLLHQMRHFSGRIHERTPAKDVLAAEIPDDDRALSLLNVAPLLARPLEGLSAGEMRRLLIARALMRNPQLLVLDEPFNGLDAATRDQLAQILDRLGAAGTQMVLITHRPADISSVFKYLLHIDAGRAVWQGRVREFLHGRFRQSDDPSRRADGNIHWTDPPASNGIPAAATMIEMRGVNVAYGGSAVLTDVHWTVRNGENWALIGPNGAGKSTLLKLITGDNLQGYANELILFGRPKGSGESVWDVKRQIGYVADDLQLRYQKKMTGFDVVCSGFFDSVGLFRHCSQVQKRTARQWLARTDTEDLASRLFSRLSYGQQRMLLIVRAMVKSPRLLILDEPCNGLDAANRRRLLAMLDLIANGHAANLLYVSHRPDELPHCITHRLHLAAGRIVKIEGTVSGNP